MRPTRDLAQTPLFQLHPEGLSLSDRIQVTYERAKAIGRSYVLTAQDLLTLSPKFWQLHTDPIWSMDGAAGTLNTLQYNCCGGTLAMFAKDRPDIAEILQQVLDFSVSGQYCLTEVGHGLDAFHLETTATLLPSGEFELNTPSERAAKYMPPTAPVGMPCIAIVFARAMIEGEDRGVKPFVVYLHNGKEMQKGVVCKVLPQRGGSRPMNHSLTYFNRVRLPYSALLGSAEKPVDPKMAFFHNISRVAVGTIAIGSLGVPALQVASFIAAKYSFRRTVVIEGQRKSVMEFRTQKTPIVTAVAQSFVMRALHEKAVSLFRNAKLDYRVRHAVASILKVVMIQHAQAAHLILGDRCGAQGLFEVNQLTAMHADMRGTAIAEGDLLGISIRFATELLLKRYAVPNTDDPASLLAKHEVGLFEEMSGQLAGMKSHRSPDFDRLILPECLHLVQAVGHRMAYDAAVAADVDPCLINLYVASCVKLDAAWYVEKLGLSRAEQRSMESDAVDVVFERLQGFLDQMDVEPYISAPLISDESWSRYVDNLVTFGDPGCLPREESVPLNEGLIEAAVVTVTA
ncbi:acyl-CoA dehydrogenase NM domain-like protein [Daedalea quercina L-15889]|uniref:Acyl-CoA dehydrogenase NM domain-like protein n=1 Tax=Daedalea quercina L-15889 TaxID=1314783 RepID=A0A165PR81_9APHY|nr:acyl-CoA dehydrogenase NM domain-like protein [Daedalea quercina L-15889]